MTVEHLHHFTAVSRHPTSEGVVVYLRCRCGQHRITRLGYESPAERLR